MKVLGRKSQSDSVMLCWTDICEPMAAELSPEKAAGWKVRAVQWRFCCCVIQMCGKSTS